MFIAATHSYSFLFHSVCAVERQDSIEEFVLAPGSPLSYEQTNGSNLTSKYLDVPQQRLTVRRSPTPTDTSRAERSNKDKKSKGKHFGMFRLHRHKNKSKKNQKEADEEEAAMLSHSAGSAFLRAKKQQVHPYNRRSFSGISDRSFSADATSLRSYHDSDTDDELMRTLVNPSGQSPSPSPLLTARTPTPLRQYSSVDSDGGVEMNAGSLGPATIDNQVSIFPAFNRLTLSAQ